MAQIIIDEEKCKGCGECVETCPAEVLELQDDKAVVANPDDCLECGSCVEVCEENAVTLVED